MRLGVVRLVSGKHYPIITRLMVPFLTLLPLVLFPIPSTSNMTLTLILTTEKPQLQVLIIISTTQSLSLFYYNCRSLIPKIDNLRAVAATHAPDVILLCETWLDSTISINELFIPNYSISRRDRNRHGGGVAIYIRDTIPYSVYISHDSIELLLVELKLKHGHLLCGVFYRSPSSKSSVLTILESTLEAIPPNRLTSLTLLGDFNIDQRNPDHPLQPHLHSIQDKLNLHQVVSEPTRSTISTDTLLDLAYLSDLSMLSSCTTEPPPGWF